MNKGFTLIEVLIALVILSLIFAVVLPVSYSLYTYYKESHEIEKIVVLLSNARRESFLYNKENVIHEKNGVLYINGKAIEEFGFRFRIDTPVVFFKNGTSSGGEINIFTEKNIYKIEINSPFGEIRYEKS